MADRPIFDGRPVLEFSTGHDRRSFLKWAGLVGVGAGFVAGGLLAAPTGADAAEILTAAADDGDLGILNYALTLEYLESDFYATGVAKGILKDRSLELITPIADHEKQHVAAITDTINTLGGKPVAKPKITYPAGIFDSADKFLATASVFEELGVTAYHGQVPLIKSGDILGAAASIAGVESRHAAILAYLSGGNSFPNPIEKHATMADILAVVKPLIS